MLVLQRPKDKRTTLEQVLGNTAAGGEKWIFYGDNQTSRADVIALDSGVIKVVR